MALGTRNYARGRVTFSRLLARPWRYPWSRSRPSQHRRPLLRCQSQLMRRGRLPAAPAPPGEAAAPPMQAEWISRCAGDGRHGALECAAERSVLLSQTSQLIAAVSLHVPADTHQPSLTVHVSASSYRRDQLTGRRQQARASDGPDLGPPRAAMGWVLPRCCAL